MALARPRNRPAQTSSDVRPDLTELPKQSSRPRVTGRARRRAGVSGLLRHRAPVGV